MDENIRQMIIQICDQKIAQKGENVGLSFYAFFENKNTNPLLLMSVATWWIHEMRFDHFEKARKIKSVVQSMSK